MCQLNAAKKIADIITEEWSIPPRPDTDIHKPHPQKRDDTSESGISFLLLKVPNFKYTYEFKHPLGLQIFLLYLTSEDIVSKLFTHPWKLKVLYLHLLEMEKVLSIYFVDFLG